MFWQIMILLVLLIPLLAIVLDSRVGEALAARLERGSPGADSERIAQRIQTLEAEVDRLTTEVERLEEESDFLHKLLAERQPRDRAKSEEHTLPPGSRPGDPTPPRRRDREDSTLRSGDEGG
ncbi:MAG: hypothetical protein R3223_01765 [Longimicrobiales bacterium]|nr:hypothetical protein [Longimicrobiales bacterium]